MNRTAAGLALVGVLAATWLACVMATGEQGVPPAVLARPSEPPATAGPPTDRPAPPAETAPTTPPPAETPPAAPPAASTTPPSPSPPTASPPATPSAPSAPSTPSSSPPPAPPSAPRGVPAVPAKTEPPPEAPVVPPPPIPDVEIPPIPEVGENPFKPGLPPTRGKLPDVVEEGKRLFNREGRVETDAIGRTLFVFDSGDKPVYLLENTAREYLETVTEHGKKKARWRISGIVTVYGGRNYVLLTKVVRMMPEEEKL